MDFQTLPYLYVTISFLILKSILEIEAEGQVVASCLCGAAASCFWVGLNKYGLD